jgi:histidinol-phosphate aminotransferase
MQTDLAAATQASAARRPQPRAAVERMAPYSPPTAGRQGKLRLDFNENTSGCSPRVLQVLKRLATRERLAVYPEYGEAREKLAAFFGMRPGELLFTNGTDEAIQVLVNTYVDGDASVLLLAPSYAMYRFYSEVAGARIFEIPYRPADLSFPLEELLDSITPETRAILIANPNNPTGTPVNLDGIRRILGKAAGAAVLIDEAYFEFYGTTALGLIGEFPNLFVSRTFSKVYGMAALRLGCLFSQAENIGWLHKAQSPYSVNALAVVCACEAVEDQIYVRDYVAEALESRRVLCQELDKLGIFYYPSAANFVLARFGSRSVEIRDRLRAKGVLVRDRSYEVPGCIRITVGRKAQLHRFLQVLREVLG